MQRLSMEEQRKQASCTRGNVANQDVSEEEQNGNLALASVLTAELPTYEVTTYECSGVLYGC